MASQETIGLLDTLEKSRLEFIDAVAGLSEDDAVASPDTNCWSALQCVEHVALVEERFFQRIESAERQETTAINPQREAELSARLADRTTRVRAPDAFHPAGRFATLQEAVDHFNTGRAKIRNFAQERSAELYLLSIDHARFGKMNGVEVLLVIAAHARRHADQIRELRGPAMS